jgi:hypothetical protein
LHAGLSTVMLVLLALVDFSVQLQTRTNEVLVPLVTVTFWHMHEWLLHETLAPP